MLNACGRSSSNGHNSTALKEKEPRPAPRRARGLLAAALLALATPSALGQRLGVARWGDRDGLPQSQVSSLARDPAGFLWVATRNGGLARFDGAEFRSAAELFGLADRVVSAVAFDPRGDLWIATGRLVARTPAGALVEAAAGAYADLAVAPDGAVWAAGEPGVLRLSATEGEIRRRTVTTSPATAVAVDAGGAWIGTREGLFRLAPGAARALRVEGIASAVTALEPTPADALLCGTEEGLFLVGTDGRPRRARAPLPGGRISALLRDARGRVWVGTRAGAFRLDAAADAVELGPSDGLPDVRVVSFLAGPSGEVWMGGDGSGLHRFTPSRFSFVGAEAGLREVLPLRIAEAPDGSAWITTARGEIARLSEGRFELFDRRHGLPPADRFRDLTITRGGRLDATFAGGLVRRERDGDPFRVFPVPPGVVVTGLALSDDVSWLGTTGGLLAFRDGAFARPVAPPLGTAPVDAIASDPAGGILFAARGAVHELDTATGRARPVGTTSALLRGAPPWDLARAADGSVWAASVRGAVRLGNGGKARLYDAAGGLPDDSVDAVVGDPEGNVWLTTDRGIVVVAPDGRPRRAYGFADGLPAEEGIVRSALLDAKGRLWFGLVGALVRYDPTAEEPSPPPPALAIERIVRGPDGRGFELDLAAIDFNDPRGVRVSWRLSPLETAFSPPRAVHAPRWGRLPPGDYLFEARAVDRRGRPGPVVSARLHVSPRWHETTLARVLLLLAALAVGAALPVTLRTGAAAMTAVQEHLSDLIREAAAPRYREISDDPFAPGSPAPLLTNGATLGEVLGTISRAWNRHAVLALLGPPGLGKSTVLADLEAGAGGEALVAIPIPPARPLFSSSRSRLFTDVATALAERGVVSPERAEKLASGRRGVAFPEALASLASLLPEEGPGVLLLEDDPGPADAEAVAARARLAAALLAAAPRVSFLVARDVEPSLFAAEEPETARLATLLRVRPAPAEAAARWLEETAGPRLRFAPGAARAAVSEAGTEPDRLRALGSALLARAARERRNRATRATVRAVLEAWDAAPPPFLGALWARLTAAERAVAAALGSLDGGRGEPRAVGEVVDLLASRGFPLGPVEVGALVPRLVECELVERDGDRVRFRNPVDARFVARHRPLSEEAASGAEVIGPYEVLATIGSGGMGTVYKARRLDTRALVALKVVHPHLLSTPEMRRRFVREGEIGVRISHPGIVRFLERGEAAGRAYIAMEYLPGRTVKDLVLAHGPLPLAFSVRVARDLADAAAALHAAGVVHRDFKSENVVVSPSGAARLLDFGLAQVAGVSRHTVSGNIVGTPDSMAPEQVRGDPAGPPADVWALGVVLYEMLSGTSPFHREGAMATFKAILEEPPISIRIGRTDVPLELDTLVLDALEKDPAERPAGAEAFRDALSALLPALPVELLPEGFFAEAPSGGASAGSAPTRAHELRPASGGA